MPRSIGVLATRYLWAGAVEDKSLGAIRMFPEPGQPRIDLKSVPADDILAILRRQIGELAREGPIESVGAGFPGVVSCGIIEESPNLGQLKGLQDALGRLNDIRVHRDFAGRIVRGKAPLPHGAYALGVVTGMERNAVAPCLAAATSSLPEIGGEAAIYVPPLEAEQWADEIMALWDDEDRRAELGRIGVARAQRFSWNRAARETLKVYRRAGYVPFGELRDFPKGRTRTFLQKSL